MEKAIKIGDKWVGLTEIGMSHDSGKECILHSFSTESYILIVDETEKYTLKIFNDEDIPLKEAIVLVHEIGTCNSLAEFMYEHDLELNDISEIETLRNPFYKEK